MDIHEQKQAFFDMVSPSHPNEWEVEETLEVLAGVSADHRHALLSHVPTIWPVSHTLCFSYLTHGARDAHAFPPELMPEWVRQILSRYEHGGLRGAREFMADIEANFLDPLRGRASVELEEIRGRMLPYLRGVSGLPLDPLRGRASVELEEIRGRMLPYLRGVSGLPLDLATDARHRLWTDTRTIFVPGHLRLFADRADNLLFFRFMVVVQWQFIAAGVYRIRPQREDFALVAERFGVKGEGGGLGGYLSRFPDPERAGEALLLFAAAEVGRRLAGELPGLVRSVLPLWRQVLARYREPGGKRRRWLLDRLALIAPEDAQTGQQHEEERVGGGAGRPLAGFVDFYERMAAACREEERGLLQLLLGTPDITAATSRIEQSRAEDRELFISLLAGILPHPAGEEKTGDQGGVAAGDADAIMLTEGGGGGEPQETPGLSLLAEIELPPELAAVMERIRADLGELPVSYVQAAAGMAGAGRTLAGAAETGGQRLAADASFVYDEWDYRRAGYRKDWCEVIEKELPSQRTGFVQLTLQKHRGLIARMRRQFEMLRTTCRFVRRRRYGDDIDFDAVVDAMGDRQAGLAPTDRLFIRLLRDQRDIASLFLVDMSNSTEGWIGQLIRETLVLLGEVMEVTGDRYGIYGFSGMRRSRCDLYHVKHLDEAYGEAVRQRISAIGPREYTRMGPPIRHLTRLLRETDARMRLLILLTDGKPEDYDGYADTYAIEDTRKALIEARGSGIHAFCVTVDLKAQDYLAHMFGQGNYVCVNRIESLPLRMAEFYRSLTS